MTTNYTIKELRARITTKGVTFPTRAEIDALVTYADKKGGRQTDTERALHAIIALALMADDIVPMTPSNGDRFTLRHIAKNCTQYVDVPLDALTATGGSMTNINNGYNLAARGSRNSIAKHLGSAGHIGWVTGATGDENVSLPAGVIRFFRRTPITGILPQLVK